MDASAQGGTELRFPIVGMGASAGGLEALQTFFDHVPDEPGIAFVVVTHQHPNHTSLMPELLAKHTNLPVTRASNGERVEADRVYVAPPGPYLSILGGELQLVEHDGTEPRLPIDHFFRALARDQGERAIGIVLSGTGTDGTLGLKEIKGAAGMVMVQDEQSARYAGMPRSAIETHLVDYVLPVERLPQKLIEYARGAHFPPALRPIAEQPSDALREIFILLRNHTGHDFSSYKLTTIRRRIERRMNIHHIESTGSYVRYLRSHTGEIDLLFKELLIGVTSFFRDSEAFAALATALPSLIEDKPDDYLFRAWVPGCATGEEAYSVAIVLRECMAGLDRHLGAQIFATDLDADAIDVARTGVYPESIAADVSKQRLERYFVKQDATYRVRQDVREMLIFAPQNVIADPPFTKLDLLSCRNLLIYLETDLQRRLLPLFHYALRPAGLLLLGSSESLGGFAGLFEDIDKKWKLFRRKEVAPGSYVAEFPAGGAGRRLRERGAPSLATEPSTTRTAHLAERLLLDQLVPPSLLIHERGDIVHIHGRTGLYLEPAPGAQPTANVFNMAREGLQIELGAALRRAASMGTEVVRREMRIKSNGDYVMADMRVRPVTDPPDLRGLFLVSFEQPRPIEAGAGADAGTAPDRATELERELQYAKESHQSTIEELETANEELKSTNEELQSTNEELQSANEELETSKEEMQSLNEELQTVNSELHGKVDELSRANDDMKNLLNGTDIATIFLDNDLRIKRFTEQAREVINLIPSDVGRPLSDLASKLRYDSLVEDATEVLRTLAFKEAEVRGGDAWYLARILPYRTAENVIDGLVLTFVDISTVKGMRSIERTVEIALADSGASMYAQDRDLQVSFAYGRIFGRPAEEVFGKTDAELVPAETAKQLAEVKRRVLDRGEPATCAVALPIDGTTRGWRLRVAPWREDGAVVGVTTIAIEEGEA